MKAFIHKYSIEFLNAIGGGVIGFIGSQLYKDWVQPVLLTIICAVISLLIGHFGKKLLNKWKL